MTYRSTFNGRPASWKSRGSPRVAATRVPCVRGCGKWICPNPTNECSLCYSARIARQRAEREAIPQRVQPLNIEPREIVLDGETYVVVWDGRGPIPRASHETPANLGSSLLDSSPLRS